MTDQDIGVNEEGLQDIELKDSPVVVNLNVTNDENLLGMVVYSDDEAYKLYNDYATRIGFSIRKEKLRFAKAVLRQREFVCSKEGFQRDSDLSKIKKFKKLQTRTGCKASIRFTVEDGEWKVTHFNPNHNHELAKPEERQFLRSDQNVTNAHSGVLCDHMQSTNMNDELSVTLRRNELMPSDYDNFTKSAATTQDIDLKDSPVVVNINVTKDGNLLGMVVYSDDEAYKLYKDYATRIGFSIRKEKLRFAKAVVRQREFVCSKEGFQRDNDLFKVKKFKKLQTRTGCKASIRFTVEDGEWKVTHFNPNHNHELAKPEERQFLRSDQKVMIAHSGVLCDHMQSTNMNDELSVTLRRNELMPSDYDNFPKSAATTQDIDLKDSPVIVNINVTKDGNLLGMVVYSDDEAYKLYKDYATRIGFSIRKEKLRFAKAVVRQREFVCSKEGFQRDNDLFKVKKFKKLQTRTGCKASIRFTVEDGEWKVTHFNPNHNHELTKPEERQVLRSNQKIANAHSSILCDHMQSANMNDELSVTLRRNELMHSVYDIFTKCAATTRHTEMCKKKVREMIELVEKDIAVLNMAKDGDEKVDRLVDSSVIDDVDKTNCGRNNSPILDPPCVQQKGVTNARIKSNLEKRKRKALKHVTRSNQSSIEGLSAFSALAPKEQLIMGRPSQSSTHAPQCTSLCQPMHPFSVPMDENCSNQVFLCLGMPTTNSPNHFQLSKQDSFSNGFRRLNPEQK